MTALVRNLFARAATETVRQSRPLQPSSAAATFLPTSSVARPGLSGRRKCRSARLAPREVSASLFTRDLLGIMVALMPPPPARHDEYMANWHSHLEKICAKTEAATIKRVVYTWKDLMRYMDHLGIKFPDPHALYFLGLDDSQSARPLGLGRGVQTCPCQEHSPGARAIAGSCPRTWNGDAFAGCFGIHS